MKPVPAPAMAMPETPTIRGWVGDAVSVREGRFYVCFEEPLDPFFVPERRVAHEGYSERHCRKEHPYLPCGWYRLVAEQESGRNPPHPTSEGKTHEYHP